MPSGAVTVCLDEPIIGVIAPELYGHFAEHLGACIDGGVWVGAKSPIPNVEGMRVDVIDAIRRIAPPIIRWPGGCFADDYHWRDGVGPREKRPRTVNLWWGQSIEDNAFGTHEFLRFCQLVGAKPYLAGNVGSGSVQELRDWVEYCNFPGDSTLARQRAANGSPLPFNVRHWGVGNENWGCGGNFCPENYAAEYKRFATYMRDYPEGGGAPPLYLIACGPDAGGPTVQNLHADWTRRFLEKLGSFPRIHALAAHYYCGTAGPGATSYDTNQWYELLDKAMRIERVIDAHRAILDEFEKRHPHRKVDLLLDEWGTWHAPTPGRNPKHHWQQNTLRDALAAAVTLDTFNRRCNHVAMGNIAQMVNVLQAMIHTDGDRLVLTPTYHVFDLYQSHQGGRGVKIALQSPDIKFAADNQRRTIVGLTGSASTKGNQLSLSLVNLHANTPLDVRIDLRGASPRDLSARTLAHDDLTAHNTFDEPDALTPGAATPLDFDDGDGARITLPPASVTMIRGTLG